MLHHIFNASRKSVLSLTAVALLASLLAACGGGGSGGGGSPAPQKLKIIAPSSNAVVNTNDEVIIEFIDAVDTSAAIKLNDIDISSLFTIDTSAKTAKASVYALQGILSAQAGESTLKASLTGARTESVSFSFEGKPELVIVSGDEYYLYGSVKGGSGQGYCGTAFDPADDTACDELGGNTFVPTEPDALSFRVLVRNAVIDSLTVLNPNNVPASVLPAAGKETGMSFGVNHLSFVNNPAYNQTTRFNQGNGETLLALAAPGQMIKGQIAAQVRSMDKNHVISQWVAEALNESLANFVSDSAPRMKGKGTPLDSDAACELLNRIQTGGNYFKCDIELVGLYAIATENDLEFEVEAQILPLTSNTPLDSGWQLKFIAKPKTQIDAKIRVTAYKTDSVSEVAGYVHAIATVSGTGDNRSIPEFNFSLNIGSAPAAELLALHIPMQLNGDAIVQNALQINLKVSDLSKPENCFTQTCLPSSVGLGQAVGAIQAEVNALLPDVANQIVYCLQPYTYAGGAFEASDAADCGFDTVPDPMQISRKERDQPIGTEEHYFSVLTAVLEQADYKASVSQGGFVAIDGSQKIRNDGVHLNALGAKATSASGKVSDKNISQVNNSDMALALSANWFNQVLLSAYQSNALGQVSMTDTVGNMGELGEYLINAGQGIIKASHTVTIDVALGAVPSMKFLEASSELAIYDAKVRVVLSSTCQHAVAVCENTINGSAKNPYVDLTMDIKARLSPSTVPGKIVAFEKDDLMLHISKASGTKVSVLGTPVFNPTPKEFYGLMLPVVNQLLEEQLGDFFQPLAYEVNFGNLCNNSSLSTVLSNFFGSGRSLSLLLKDLTFDTTNSADEAEHVLAYGQVVDTNDVNTLLDTPLFQLTLNYEDSTSCEVE